jgi:hypothetical protein
MTKPAATLTMITGRPSTWGAPPIKRLSASAITAIAEGMGDHAHDHQRENH